MIRIILFISILSMCIGQHKKPTYFTNTTDDFENLYLKLYSGSSIHDNYLLRSNYYINGYSTYIPVSHFDLIQTQTHKVIEVEKSNSIKSNIELSTTRDITEVSYGVNALQSFTNSFSTNNYHGFFSTNIGDKSSVYASVDMLKSDDLNITSVVNTPTHIEPETEREHLKLFLNAQSEIAGISTRFTTFLMDRKFDYFNIFFSKNNIEHQPRAEEKQQFFGLQLNKDLDGFNVSLKGFYKTLEEETGDGKYFDGFKQYNNLVFGSEHGGAGLFSQQNDTYNNFTKFSSDELFIKLTASKEFLKHSLFLGAEFRDVLSKKYTIAPALLHNSHLDDYPRVTAYHNLVSTNYGYDVYGNDISDFQDYYTKDIDGTNNTLYKSNPAIGYSLLSVFLNDNLNLTDAVSLNVGFRFENYSYNGLKKIKNLSFQRGSLISIEDSNFVKFPSVSNILPRFSLSIIPNKTWQLNVLYNTHVLYPSLERYYYKSWETYIYLRNNAVNGTELESLHPDPVIYNELRLLTEINIAKHQQLQLSYNSISSTNELGYSFGHTVFRSVTLIDLTAINNPEERKQHWLDLTIDSSWDKNFVSVVNYKTTLNSDDIIINNTIDLSGNNHHLQLLNPFSYTNEQNKDYFRSSELFVGVQKEFGSLSVNSSYQWKSGYNYYPYELMDIIRGSTLRGNTGLDSEKASPSISQLNISLSKDIKISSALFNLKLSVTNVLDKTNELIVYHDSGKASNTNHLNTNQGEGDIIVYGARYASELGISQEAGEEMYISDRKKRENNPYHYGRPREISLTVSIEL